MKKIIKSLEWRYATKLFDSEKKLKNSDFEIVKESLRLSASSFGLQPWKFVIVSNPELRTKMRKAAWDQSQVTDASHVLVLAIKKNIDEAYVDAYVKDVARTRGIGLETLSGYAGMMKGFIKGKTPEQLKEWSTKQLYIALGTALTVMAEQKIDACPMEGFDPAAVDTILGLQKQGLESRVLLPIGYRSKKDASAKYKKVRFPSQDVFITVS